MNCEQARIQLLELLYGEREQDGVQEITSHLKECADCRRLYDELAATRDCLNSAQPTDAEITGSEQIWHRAWAQTQRSRQRWRRATWAVATAASLLLLVWLSQLRITVHQQHLSIGWMQSAASPTATGQATVEQQGGDVNEKVLSLETALAQQDKRIREMDRLVRLLERVTEVEHQARVRDLVSLEVQLQAIADRNDTRWNTVAHVMQNRRPSGATPSPTDVLPEGGQP